MTPNSAPHPRNDLVPSLEALLRASDPTTSEHAPGLERSRANTSGIPTGHYAPAISQNAFSMSRSSQDDAFASGPNQPATRSLARRHRGSFLAVAAGAALIAGIAAVGPWAGISTPAPGPAASVPTGTAFDPNDPLHLQALQDPATSGPRLTGILRAALPTDPPELQGTGWLMNVKSMFSGNWDETDRSGADLQTKIFNEWTWIPVDLTGLNTSRLVSAPPTGVVAAITVTNLGGRLITPITGPYGVLLSDQHRLSASSVGDARSLMTLDGIPLDIEDVSVTGSPLDQFATFDMKFAFADLPQQEPILFQVRSFQSYTDTEAKSCISFGTADAEKILAFPSGSTASSAAGESSLDGGPIASLPLRITSPRAAGDVMDLLEFVLDTGADPNAALKAWPTGTTGTCGDRTGEIVKFAGIKE